MIPNTFTAEGTIGAYRNENGEVRIGDWARFWSHLARFDQVQVVVPDRQEMPDAWCTGPNLRMILSLPVQYP